jgi:hypothetical protein
MRKMNKRIPDTEAEVAALTLDQLNAEIKRCLWGAANGGTSQGRKAFFKQFVWLKKQGEAIHGTPAKARDFRR